MPSLGNLTVAEKIHRWASAYLLAFVLLWPFQRPFPGTLIRYLSDLSYSHGLSWKASTPLESFCSEHFSMNSSYPCGHNDWFKDEHWDHAHVSLSQLISTLNFICTLNASLLCYVTGLGCRYLFWGNGILSTTVTMTFRRRWCQSWQESDEQKLAQLRVGGLRRVFQAEGIKYSRGSLKRDYRSSGW